MVGHEAEAALQMEQVHAFLTTKQAGFFHESVQVKREIDGEISDAVLLATPQQLILLQKPGHLSQMDATHKTNWLGWLLYTLHCRDEYGGHLPVAHFITAREDGVIIAACLRKIKQWVVVQTGEYRFSIVCLLQFSDNVYWVFLGQLDTS